MPAGRADMDDQRILDRYRLIERVAVGGSAEVWRAHDDQLDRPVAVKRLHPHLVPDAASRKRLGSEARAAGRLTHPVIVSVYDVDLDGDWPALVMELIDGESLAVRISRDGPLPAREAAEIAADLADALYHAHRQGVIHRDVKSGNVLLARDGQVRLVDFGIAHSLAEAAERLTLTGTVMGTLHAMAPEQLAGEAITPRTDLYGLGVVLYEMLTGKPPYAGGSPLALAEAQQAGPAPVPSIDPVLWAIVEACLAYDVADRPIHAGAVANALRRWLAGDLAAPLALAPPPDRSVDTQALTQPVPVPVLADAAPAAPPTVRGRPVLNGRRWFGVTLGVAAAVLLLVAGMALVNDRVPDSAEAAAPTPTATPEPPWLAGLAAAIGEACGEAAAEEARAELASMSEEEATDHAEEQVAACAEDDGEGEDDKPKKGGGNGRGNGGRGNGG